MPFATQRPGAPRLALCLLILPVLAAAAGLPARAQDSLGTEIHLAVEAQLPERGKKPKEIDLAQLEEVLRQRLRIYPEKETRITVRDPQTILVRIPATNITPEQLRLFTQPGRLEVKHLKDVQTSFDNKARYQVDVRRIVDARGVTVITRFRDVKSDRIIPVEEFLSRCPLLVDNSDIRPNSARAITEGLRLAVQVSFTEQATRRLRSFRKKPGRLFALALDGELLTINGVVRPPERPRKKKRDEPENETESEREDDDSLLEITGGIRTEPGAHTLAAMLNSGPLPVPLKVISTRVVGD